MRLSDRIARSHAGRAPARLARHGRALLAALLLAVLWPALLAAAPARAATGLEVAVQDDPTFLDPGTQPTGLALAAGIHATAIRFNVVWANVNWAQASQRRPPAQPEYTLDQLDQAVSAARAAGMTVQLTLGGPAPAWATADHRIGGTAPAPRRFARFAATVASRFRGRVARYAVWNEPNLTGWLRGTRRISAARSYRGLYVAAFAAIKRADPAAKVLIGETSPQILRTRHNGIQPLRFLREVACVDAAYRRVGRCKRLVADGYAHHPYDPDHVPSWRRGISPDGATIGTLDHLTRALDRLRAARALSAPRGRRLGVYLTEFGYFGHGHRALSKARRAAYLPQAFEIARRNPRVRQMLHYELLHRPWRDWDTGLATLAGVPDPAYRTLAAWASEQDARGRLAR